MSVKALRNQLLAAIAMVLVATIALGSSTYAWFVNNGVVKAEGMSVQVSAERGIEIAFKPGTAAPADTDYKTTASANMESAPQSLMAISTADTINWYHAHAESASASVKKGNDAYQTYTVGTESGTNIIIADGVGSFTKNVGDDAFGETGDYFIAKDFVIRSTSTEPATALKIDSISVTGGADATKNAIRVAVVTYDPTNNTPKDAQLFAPNHTDGAAVNSFMNVAKAGGIGATFTYADSKSQVSCPYTGEIDKEKGINIRIYVFFEGEDNDLKSDALTADPGNLSVSVQFSATTEQA